MVLQMDSMKNLLLPKLHTKEVVFKQKLNVHNNTFINLANGYCKCYFFDESEADLKASTHVTTVIDFLELQANINPSSNTIYLMSDTCV